VLIVTEFCGHRIFVSETWDTVYSLLVRSVGHHIQLLVRPGTLKWIVIEICGHRIVASKTWDTLYGLLLCSVGTA